MAESGVSYREVLQCPRYQNKWRDISVNTGGAPSPLQDIKLPESAGGFAFKDGGRDGSPVRNRFIYWRINHDVLELVEQSMDTNLIGSCVRYRFQDTPILSGISIVESHSDVVILVATVSSVHRLLFSHPTRISTRTDPIQCADGERTAWSIFHDASINKVASHPIQTNGNPAYQIHTSATWLTTEGDSLFAMATNTGSILLIKMPPHVQSLIIQYELKQSSVMHRLWTGLVPAMIRGGQEANDMVQSLCFYSVGGEPFIFSVCKDHKIRMWACKSLECLIAVDVLDFLPGHVDPQMLSIGVNGHMIRKANGTGGGIPVPYLGVFLSFSDRCQFCILQPILVDGRYQLKHITNVFAPSEDLVDFCLTSSHLWAVWTNSESETFARCVCIDVTSGSVGEWHQVYLEPAESSELEIAADKDPRESYMEAIFKPGKFFTHDIIKALNIYRRSMDVHLPVDQAVSFNTLKDEVTFVLEDEIQRCAQEFEMAEEEVLNLQIQQWGKFYSSCVHYHEVGTRSVGLFTDFSSGLICLVKKSCISILRPCETTEQLYLSPAGTLKLQFFEDMHIMLGETQAHRDLLSLLKCIQIVRSYLTPDMVGTFDDEMYRLGSPQNLASQAVTILLTDAEARGVDPLNGNIVKEVKANIQNVVDLSRALENLVQGLDVMTYDMAQQENGEVDTARNTCSHLYSSNDAIAILSRSLCHLVETRVHITRDLLILETILVDTSVGDQAGLSLDLLERISSDLIPRTTKLLHAYHSVNWMITCPATPVQNSTLEASLRQLAALDLSESSAAANQLIGAQNLSLLELFLHGIGGSQTRYLLANTELLEEERTAFWTVPLQLLWPLNGSFLFPEFLMEKCQYLQLQEYVRLLSGWCELNLSSRMFLLGHCYLNTREPYKAVDCLLNASHDVSDEVFLFDRLLQVPQPEDVDGKKMTILYYLKVIKLFEQFDYPDIVIALATTAISKADDDDLNLPTLWSKKFKQHLELGHNEEAYSAMISNPDPSRRKDCLRQFLVVLCERRQLHALVEFPYVDMYDDVVSIMESRARSVDLSTHNYYNLLYAFHTFRGNFRKAGNVMYEYGMRLGREMPGLKGLQRQAKCYLAAMNALQLVDPKYAWIVTPSIQPRTVTDDQDGGRSPKRNSDGDEIVTAKKSSMTVLELSDLEKEYLLIHARLKLLKKDCRPSHTTGPTPSADEMAALLTTAGLFDQAILVCLEFKLPLTVVFEGLATRCIWLSQGSSHHMVGDNDYTSSAWDWLSDNELGARHTTKEVNAPDEAWRLLNQFLNKYEEKGHSVYHRCVSKKLLSQGYGLPSWLLASYKKVNLAELLRLQLDHNLLEDSFEVIIEYIDAVLGKGKEYFGLKNSLHCAAPSVWMPYTSIDQLLSTLKDSKTDSDKDLYNALKEKLQAYHMVLEKVSRDRLDAAVSRGHTSMLHQSVMLF
ncbi:nuclear pore complex protein Nup160-like isoform X2 [Lineus longissimus]|uniref:nuclear pore complex protein Nup160-like isoform X2 n=1 Tax=Lineus longissimus TaxID=88925 RepID=UPI00315D01DA